MLVDSQLFNEAESNAHLFKVKWNQMIMHSQLEQMGKEVTRPVRTFQIQVQIQLCFVALIAYCISTFICKWWLCENADVLISDFICTLLLCNSVNNHSNIRWTGKNQWQLHCTCTKLYEGGWVYSSLVVSQVVITSTN